MWLIRGEALMRLPDSGTIPPGFRKIEPPEDFVADPASFRIDDGKIVRLDEKEKLAARHSERLSLTQEEIAKVKLAIAKGII